MKKCPNCGASINPYMVKCEYCRSWVFDWDAWLKDGEPCYVNFNFDYDGESAAFLAKAIPHFETIEVTSESKNIMDKVGNVVRRMPAKKTCEIHATFTCIENEDRILYQVVTKDGAK